MSVVSSKTYAQVSVEFTVRVAPPPLPFYTQPPCPVDDYLWTPGYWAYSDDGYYWVPGVWVRPPHYGFFWTPCYWGFNNGYYGFHSGYWGPHVGYYGGVNYGHGYYGSGFHGGRWEGEHFRYNTAVVNVNRTVIHRTYAERAEVNNNNRASYNGPGGVNTRPNRQEAAAMRERHDPPTREQSSHQQGARRDPNQFAKVNRGRPSKATMNRVDGQGYDPRGQHASTRPETARNQQNNNRSERQTRTMNTSNSNHSTQPSQHRDATPANNRTQQQTRTVHPTNNNNRTAQPSSQRNANPSNSGREQRAHKVNQPNNNNRAVQSSQNQQGQRR